MLNQQTVFQNRDLNPAVLVAHNHRAFNGLTTKHSGWSAVIVIDPKEFPRIEEMPVYWWHAQINRGTMGEGRAINKASTVLTKKSETAAPPGKKGTGKVKSKSLLEMDDDELDQALGSPAGADGKK